MMFKWRRHILVTAFAAMALAPLAGCSSQQQQATDEVAAEDGQDSGEADGQQASASTQGDPAGGDETAATQQTAGNPTENGASGGENVVSNNAAPAAEGSANGDLQEIITEMNGDGSAKTAENTTGAAPTNEAAAPDPAAVNASNPGAETAEVPVTAGSEAAPAAVPTVAGLPESGSKMSYVVEAGDTLAKIATKIYGEQKRWKDIAGLSGLDNPNHIYPGDLVYYSLDDASKSFAANYESIKRSQETVRDGDTLAAIAKRVYGNSNLWKHIWRQNDHIDNPDKLSAGMTVYYMDRGAIKTALNKIKNTDFAKASASFAKKIQKSTNVLSVAKTMFTTNALAVLAATA